MDSLRSLIEISCGTSLTILVQRTQYDGIKALRLWKTRELLITSLLAALYIEGYKKAGLLSILL